MKKLIGIILLLTILLTLCACGKTVSSDDAADKTAKETGNEVASDKAQEEVFSIEANGLTLKYPAKWQDTVNVEVSEKKVSFSYDDIALFDLIFGESNEYLLGTYGDTEIHICAYDVDEDGVTEEQFDNICAMQDDVNVLVKYLQDDVGFKLS